MGQLFAAGREAEIGCGAPHVMDVSLKLRILRQKPCLFHQGFVAPRLDNPPLMESQGAKAACAKTSPVADQAKLHFLDGRHPPCLLIRRVVATHVRKAIDLIHLLLGQRRRRRVLDNILPIAPPTVRLYQTLSRKRVRVAVLNGKAAGIFPPVPFHVLVIRQQFIIINPLQAPGPVNGAVYKGYVFNVNPRIQSLRNFHDGMLPHAIGQQVRLGIQQYGPLQPVGPIIIMGQPAQAGLDPPDYNGGIFVG